MRGTPGRGLLQSPPNSKHHHPPHPASPSPPLYVALTRPPHEPDSTSSAQRSTPLCGACMRALQHPSRAPGRGAPAWLRAAVAQLLRLRGSGGQVDAAACWRGWGGGGGQPAVEARASLLLAQQKLRARCTSISNSNRFQWLPKTQILTTLTLIPKMRPTCAVQATFASCAGRALLAFKSARTSSTSRR